MPGAWEPIKCSNVVAMMEVISRKRHLTGCKPFLTVMDLAVGGSDLVTL